MSVEQLIHESVEHVHGPEKVIYGEDELIVTCLVRDGRPYVKAFVEHYRSLGAKHIFFLDNGSADGTVEVLKGYGEGVSVFFTPLPYKLEGAPVKDDPVGNGWTREIPFKQYLYARFGGRDRWCLYADVDEFFDYPYSDVIGLGSFLSYLNENRYTAVAAQMIDMFPEEPLSGKRRGLDEPLKEIHRFCDLSNVKRRRMKGTEAGRKALDSRNTTVASEDLEFFGHGIRTTVFGTKPHLTKFPLVFLDGETKPVDRNAHRVANATVADITCAFFHYKFVDAHLQEQIAQAVREEHRLEGSDRYKTYQRVMGETTSLRLKREGAIEVAGVNDLLDNATLVVSEEYVDWVGSEEKSIVERSGDESGASSDACLKARRRERAKTLRVQRLDRSLREAVKRHVHRVRKLQEEAGESRRLAEELARRNGALERRVAEMQEQMEGLRSSKGWRVLNTLHRIGVRASKVIERKG